MNKLQKQVYKLNLDYFYNNFLDQKLWGKQWTIFEYGDVEIMIRLQEIEVWNESIELIIAGYHTNNETGRIMYDPQWLSLPLHNRNYQVTTNALHRKVFNIIEELERDIIKESDLYRAATEMDNELLDIYEKEAISFLDEEGVKNEEIRNIFIDNYVREQEDYKYRNRVIDDLKYCHLSACYLAYALFVGDDEKYDFYKSKITDGEALSDFIKEQYEELFGDELEME